MKELIKRPSDRHFVHARNYEPGKELIYDIMMGDTLFLRTDSDSMQVTIEEIENEKVTVRIDSFETSVNSENDGYRVGESIVVSRQYLWPSEPTDVTKE